MILFHGCWTTPEGRSDSGHYWAGPGGLDVRYSMRRKVGNRLVDNPYRYVPWGHAVDGELAPYGDALYREGIVALSQCGNQLGRPEEEWWTAISWWDNSVDSRQPANATFVVDARCDAGSLLAQARTSFPQIFARFKYELVLP